MYTWLKKQAKYRNKLTCSQIAPRGYEKQTFVDGSRQDYRPHSTFCW